jgi:lipoate-protein ligase A
MYVENWRLIDLGMAEPYVAQCFYEAVALAIDRGLSPNTIILVQPASPYVCLGYHQILEKEVDVEFCKKQGLPIIRRSQGGGTVYLNNDQVFYQVVASEDSKVIPHRVDELFEKLLQVTVYVYRKLGLEAEFKPLNDVVVNNRKISGNGAGRIGKAIILVGNIILDLDYDLMARVLKIPDEKFRDKMAKSMREWVTSLKRELGYIPSVDEIKKLLVEGYEKILGIKLIPSSPSEDELHIFENEVKPKHMSYEWLHMPELTHRELTIDRAVKIADGVKVIEVVHKAKKLIKVTAEVIGDKIFGYYDYWRLLYGS